MANALLVCRVALIGSSALLGSVVCLAQGSIAQPPDASKSGAPSDAPPKPIVAYKDGRLTVNVQRRPLTDVLNQISRIGRIAVATAEDFSGHRISVAFDNLPLEEGLHRILDGYDSFFFFGVDQTPPARLRAIWVYSRGRGDRVSPVPPELWASTKDLREQLASGDAESRATAIEAILEREGQRGYEALASALADPDAQVRSRALYAAGNGGVEIPVETLLGALADPSVDVRFLALQTLANGPAAQAGAEYARRDASTVVRKLAEQVLGRLKAKSR